MKKPELSPLSLCGWAWHGSRLTWINEHGFVPDSNEEFVGRDGLILELFTQGYDLVHRLSVLFVNVPDSLEIN